MAESAASQLEQTAHSPYIFQQFIAMVVQQCLDETLLTRQYSLTFYGHNEHAPIKEDVSVTLGVLLREDGTKQMTRIGNVERILSGTTIGLGSQIGDGSIIKRAQIEAGATIEPYSLLEFGTYVGEDAIISQGGKLCTQSQLGARAIMGEGAELNYDTLLDTDQKVEPFTVHY